MAIQKITIDDLFKMSFENILIIDVRSPAEFEHAHIPKAINLPLFNNEERKIVGTAYKQKSREEAIKIGLNYFGVKMSAMIETVEEIIAKNKKNKDKNKLHIIVHCWRGGMRSAGVAWLLDLYGFKVSTIIGGYKSYRNWVLKQFEVSYKFRVIGGYTGSGKTETLYSLEKLGATIIDFEKIAGHKGSAFGNLAEIPQPTQEMFENNLALELFLKKENSIWIEDESQRIGNINLPSKIHNQKQKATVYFIEIPFEERLEYIIKDYGKFSNDKLINAIIRIKKRLGGLDTKNAINFILENDIKNCFSILLKYYDKYYYNGLFLKENIDNILHKILCDKVDSKENANKLLNETQ